MVFIEDIVGIALVVEKCQREGRLAVGIDIDVTAIYSVLLKETDDALPYPVVACLTDKR